MYEQNTPPNRAAGQDAIDINDFVYAATGARVRRLTMPDGEHWFPAADVIAPLGYANTRQAINWHVPESCINSLEDLARSVYGVDASSKIAGHGLKKSMKMVNLPGLIRLVNGCTKPESEPFKNWVADVVVTIQRDGSYSLEKAEVQPATPETPTAYAMPKEVADAIVRLEEHNLRMDAEFAASQQEAARARQEIIEVLRKSTSAQREAELQAERTRHEIIEAIRESTAVQRDSMKAQQTAAHALMRFMAETPVAISALADRMGGIADRLPPVQPAEPRRPRMTADVLLADWRDRNLIVTGDIWGVAAYIAPALAQYDECRYPLDIIAAMTGLTIHRVHDALRMLLKRGCIRQTGVTPDGAPVYVLA